MQVVISATDEGTQMGPLSSVAPTPMLPVVDRPVAAHVADAAISGGATELIVVAGERDAQIREYFGASYDGVPVKYPRPVDPGSDPIRAGAQYIDGRFAVLDGTTIFEPNAIKALFDRQRPIVIPVTSDNPGDGAGVQAAPRYTMPPNGGGSVPAPVGIDACVVPEAIASAVETQGSAVDLPAVLASAREAHAVDAVEITPWLNITIPDDLHRANARILNRQRPAVSGWQTQNREKPQQQVAERAVIAPSATLTGPVAVARNATIHENAELVGPVVVHPNTTVGREAYLDRVLLLPGASIPDDGWLENTILGPNCEVGVGARIGGKTKASRGSTAAIVSRNGDAQGGLTY